MLPPSRMTGELRNRRPAPVRVLAAAPAPATDPGLDIAAKPDEVPGDTAAGVGSSASAPAGDER